MENTILGLETSCDETAVALVTDQKVILSHRVWSHVEEQKAFGGVIPEISARAHLRRLDELIHQCLQEASLSLSQVSGIAATGGPGLIGGVIVGTLMAKALASSLHKPFLAVNHLMAHALTPRLFYPLDFPYLVLLVSGGHCQLLVAFSPVEYKLLGETLDDAVGEAFDKVGKLLGISYPAGPQIEKLAQRGHPQAYVLPKPLLHQKEKCDFSFSGLKTAVRHLVQTREVPLTDQERADVCASFQDTVAEVLKAKTRVALQKCREENIPLTACIVAGGVASNQYLFGRLQDLSLVYDLPILAPPPAYCTDNGAMIAWAGVEMMRLGRISPLDFAPRPRWPLEEKES